MKKKMWERVVLVLGIFLVVAAVFYTIVNYSASRQLSKEREKTEASGGHLDWRDLVPPPIPDDENAAIIYQKVFPLMEKGNEEEEEAFKVVFKGDRVNWSEEDVQVIRSLVEKNKEALSLIWEATLREKCRFPLAYENGPAVLLPHLTNMRRGARLLAAKALLQKEDGEVEEAVETCKAGLRMGRSLQPEPLLISQFVRIAINSIVLHSLELILNQNEANPMIYSTLLKELDEFEGHEAFTRCLEGERTIVGLWIFNKLREEPSEWRSIMGGLSGGIWMRLYVTPLGRPLFKKDEVCWLRTWEKDIASSKLSIRNASRVMCCA